MMNGKSLSHTYQATLPFLWLVGRLLLSSMFQIFLMHSTTFGLVSCASSSSSYRPFAPLLLHQKNAEEEDQVTHSN